MPVVESPSNAPARAAEAESVRLETRSGVRLDVRPAGPQDEERLLDFFGHVAPEDLRFRFLSPVRQVRPAQVHSLVDVDHRNTENFLAFDSDSDLLVATAMLAAEPGLDRAEVAIAIRADYRNRGLGWTLLGHVSEEARARGIGRLESIECADNRDAISLEREMGFVASAYPGDATLTLVAKDLGGAPQE